MLVKALQSFTYANNVLSMYQGEVADIDDTIASDLIAEGFVKEYSEGGIEVEPLSVTENDTYTAPSGKAYSPVTVNVSGGGSGDFSVVEMTFVLGGGVTEAYVYGTFIHDYGLETETTSADLYVTSSATVHTVLYKGVGHIATDPGYKFDGENITEWGEFTGGGSVTINQSSD